MTRLHLKRASPDQEFPNLCGNLTWMARVLTPAMYQRQFHRCTQSGVIFDDVIRPGLEAPGDDAARSRQSRITGIASTVRPSDWARPVNIRKKEEEAELWHGVPSRGQSLLQKTIYTIGLPVSSGCAADWSSPASVGCAAGDAQSYTLFCDFFDRIIEAYHGRQVSGHTPKSDYNSENLKVAPPAA